MAYVRVGSSVNEPLGSLFRTKVVNGVLAPTVLEMSAAEQAAVGAFVDAVGRPFCTGTLISPFVVLSAAHCGVSVGDRFVLGPDAAEPSATAYVAEVRRSPKWSGTVQDHLLVLLDRNLPADPLAVASAPPMVDAVVQGVGYGMTDPEVSDNTKRWWVAEPVIAVSGGWFMVSGQGQRGLCLGDSGGPAIVATDKGPAIVGTISQGAVSCTGEDIYSSPDPAWVASTLAEWKTPGRKPLKAWVPRALVILGLGLAAGLLVSTLRR